jgi:phospholipid transport system substrate-binding protein
MIKLITKYVAIVVVLMAFNSAVNADELDDLTNMMKSKVNYIIKVLKDNNLTKFQKDVKLNDSIEGLFDYRLMARLSVGKRNWVTLNSSKKQEFVKLFSTRMKESYTEKSHMLSDEKVVVNSAIQVKKSRISVPVTINGTAESTEMVYKFYHSKKAIWLIYDVEIAGVSILQTYRAQFAEILKDGDMQELINKLKTD